MVAIVVIMMGRKRVRPASTVASPGICPAAQNVGEVDQQNPVRHHDAYHHDDTHEAVHAQLGAGQVQHDETPDTPRGTLNMMTSGSMSDLNWLASTMYTRPAP